jgi:hypothetical protein
VASGPALTWHPGPDQRFLQQQQAVPQQQQVVPQQQQTVPQQQQAVPHHSDSQLGGGGYFQELEGGAQAAPSQYDAYNGQYDAYTGSWAAY